MEFLGSPPKYGIQGRKIYSPYSMAHEEDMGIVPSAWSTSSQMRDPRPNGRSIFDARFSDTPMGRSRGYNGIIWDPRSN